MIKSRKRYRTKTEREGILEEFVESGLGQRAFCEERGIGIGTFQYWLRKTRESEDSREVEPESAPLVEVKLEANGGALWGVEGSRESAEYEVVLRDGKRLM